jgi:predicted DNA-binding protein (MmcQ/YjbR family)
MKPSPARDFDPQRRLAAALPAATEDIKWGADLVYSVGGKMFCIFLLDGERATTCSVKVDADRFLELTGLVGVEPAPYLARAHWVQLRPGHALAADDLDSLIRRSHALVAARLTRKRRSELGLA